MLDTTVKQAEDIENIGMQVAGIIPLYEKDAESKMLQNKTKKSKNKSKLLKLNPKKTINKKLKDPELVVLENVKSPITEAFRTLRTNLTFSNDSQAMKNILVTSSNSRDGKSYVSANLATIFSKTNKKVILIDADMRKGRQNKIFKVSNSHGLANCLVDMTPKAKMELSQMDKYIKETNIPNLHIMTSGDRPTNPAELLSSTRILKLLELLDSMYDIVIIDGTPSTIVSDSLAIAKFVDITLVVAAYKTTKMEALKEIDKSFENVGGKIFGVILNKYPISKSTYTESYYYDDNKEKKEHLDVQEVKNKSVADLIDEAIKKAKEKEKVEGIQSIDEQFLYNIENNSNGNYVNNYMELQINNITNELEDIKKIFVKSVNDNQKVDSQDITDIKLEINYMKKMLDLKEALDTSKEIHEEIKNLREMVESLLEEQKENEEKVKTFIHEYRKNVIDKRNKDIY
jgi:capsular exopolysaccharide synthesis family protein